jgi:ferredoxin hydrogenase large subunit
VRNAETFNADFLPHLSTAKSPIQMGGVLAKVWAPKFLYNTDPRNVKVVAIAPCTAKILEASRPEMDTAWRYHIKAGTIPAALPRR